MKKRLSPKETLEKHNPKVEHIYVKFPGEELQDVTLTSTADYAYSDDKRLFEILNPRTIKKPGELSRFQRYTHIHNHPVMEGEVRDETMPSPSDIRAFLESRAIKTMAIAQQDTKTGEVQGYIILRKKAVRPIEEETTFGEYEVGRRELRDYVNTAGVDPKEALEELADKYNLQYKWLAAKGYKLSKEIKKDIGWRFIKKNRSLETVAITTAVIGLLGAIYFFSFNFTGNVVVNLTNETSDWIGGVLFIIGLVGAFTYFKIK